MKDEKVLRDAFHHVSVLFFHKCNLPLPMLGRIQKYKAPLDRIFISSIPSFTRFLFIDRMEWIQSINCKHECTSCLIESFKKEKSFRSKKFVMQGRSCIDIHSSLGLNDSCIE